MNDKRFQGMTYEELFERDWNIIKKDIHESNIFDFTYGNELNWGGLWIEDAISERSNPILNPNNYTDKAIKEIHERQNNLFESEVGFFFTNIGDFQAKYCYIDKYIIIFYDKNKNKVASINKSIISELHNDEQYIID